ncbi:MAG TPA: hypothetical protein K8V00_03135 [Ligilactobacillus acidipiscis]|uniref:Phage protein n=1 Tax=Ligilactobacillus acidipiscis TaxID=89059 RepID=A0A921K079_9LACO|nr:hypothetical protein [Ligilactobacillus acidipiscis]
MAKIKIKLRDKKGQTHSYEQSWIPTRKLIESFDINTENYPTLKEYYEKTIDFVASVFDDKRVTSDTILDGVSAQEFDDFMADFFDQLAGGTDPNLEPENE